MAGVAGADVATPVDPLDHPLVAVLYIVAASEQGEFALVLPGHDDVADRGLELVSQPGGPAQVELAGGELVCLGPQVEFANHLAVVGHHQRLQTGFDVALPSGEDGVEHLLAAAAHDSPLVQVPAPGVSRVTIAQDKGCLPFALGLEAMELFQFHHTDIAGELAKQASRLD